MPRPLTEGITKPDPGRSLTELLISLRTLTPSWGLALLARNTRNAPQQASIADLIYSVKPIACDAALARNMNTVYTIA